jgi:glycosyltransferase involved in cell wall biosynthesis
VPPLEPDGAICVGLTTRNRADTAIDALDSVLPQLNSRDELIVVVSASTDATLVRVEDWLTRNRPNGRILVDAVGGVSRGRNLVLEHSSTSVVCFLDDDELAAPDWLERLRIAWSSAGDEVAVLGGKVLPVWEAERPRWLHDDLLYVLGLLDLGPQARQLDQRPATGYIWGGNISMRREAVRAAGGFDERKGVRPEAPADRGEEEELQRRLAAKGWGTLYDPTIAVFHRIGRDRTNRRYFWRAFCEEGRASQRGGASRRGAAVRLAKALARLMVAAVALRGEDMTRASFSLTSAWVQLT